MAISKLCVQFIVDLISLQINNSWFIHLTILQCKVRNFNLYYLYLYWPIFFFQRAKESHFFFLLLLPLKKNYKTIVIFMCEKEIWMEGKKCFCNCFSLVDIALLQVTTLNVLASAVLNVPFYVYVWKCWSAIYQKLFPHFCQSIFI